MNSRKSYTVQICSSTTCLCPNSQKDGLRVFCKHILCCDQNSKINLINNKKRNHVNWCNYKCQRNGCLSILRKTKKECFNSFNIKHVSDNKLYWKSVKPFFNGKGSNSSKKR